jgi:hypothetical protein
MHFKRWISIVNDLLKIQPTNISKGLGYIPNQLEKAYFQVPLNGLGFIRGARRSPLMCKGRLALEFKLSLK